MFAEAAKTLGSKILFVKSTTSEEMQKKLADYVGITGVDTPAIRIIYFDKELSKYAY